MAIIGQDSGTYTKADADRKRELAKQLMGSGFRAKNPLGALAMALEGGVSGMYDKEASGAEAAGSKQIAELLQGKDYAGVMGNEWANPQQSALASMLQGREWNQQDQAANWAREDSRFAQQQALEREKMSQPEWGFENINGDIVAYNKRDPSGGTQTVYDGPAPVADQPTSVQEFQFSQENPEFAQFLQNKSGPLVNVNTGDGADSALNKALSTQEGESWATIKDAGMVAGAMGQDLGLLDELIKVAPQGPIIGPLAETFKGFNSAGDAFQSIVKRVAPSLRTPGSGATSDIEYQGFLDSLPALKNSPEGNMLINQIMKSKAAINKQRSDIVTAYQAGDLSAEQARAEMARLNSASIVTPEMRKALAGVGATEPSGAPEVGTVVEGWVYNGGDPSLQSSWSKQ